MNSLCVYDYRLPHATPAGGPTSGGTPQYLYDNQKINLPILAWA